MYAKIGGIAALAAILLWSGWHFGGMSADEKLANYKTAVEAQYAANLKTVADTLNKQIQDGVADRAAQKKVIDAYDADKANPPATAGLADSLRDATQSASCPASRDVPKAGTVAGGAQGATAKPSGGPSVERLSGLVQAVFDSSDADAKQMNAMIKLAP